MNREILSARRDEIRDALSGPVASVRTPFLRDGAIDYDGLRNYVEFCIDAGTKSLILTFGDSLFSVLTEREIVDVTRAVADHARGRAAVCGATGMWATRQSVEYASFCRDLGVDLVMALPPDWGKSCGIEELVAHYDAISREAPVMIVTNLFIARGDAFGLRAVEAIRDRVPGVVAVKDDVCGDFGRRLSAMVHDRWAVLVGGQKRNHLSAAHYGVDGYLSTYLTFSPPTAFAYWRAVGEHRFDEAAAIIAEKEIPLFDHITALPGGFDAGLHGIYELVGIYGRWRRAPYRSLDDHDMEALADVCKRLSIIR